MKHFRKAGRVTALIMAMVMLLSLTGCSESARMDKYEKYISSLITANYIGTSSDYVRATGADKDDIEGLYLQNASRLANNLGEFYDLRITSDHDLAPALVDLSKTIYSRTRFEVGEAYKENDNYYVPVTIYPINIINQTEPEVRAYIDDFNRRVEDGEFNDYEEDAYEKQFASGIIDILKNATEAMEYGDPVELTVRILQNENSFYISDDDFRRIDEAVLLVDAAKTEAARQASATDAEPSGEPE